MQEFIEKFMFDFIEDNRWKFIVDGLKITIEVTILAVIFGILIGLLIAIVRVAHDQQDKARTPLLGRIALGVADTICRIYVTIIRGTPAMIQLLIMYFIILVSADSKVLVAVVTFSMNSGAYVSEIFRGGIMAVDKGQMEAGRSLGLGYVQTMIYIVLPQAFKSVMPSLANELITLLKETSICGYIGLNELTRGGDIIRGNTFDALLPLFAVALIYLTIVLGLTAIFNRMERKLRISDNR